MENGCLYPECETQSKVRGLCAIHYQYALRLVKRNKTTWEDLEKGGKSLPSTHRAGKVSSWFLDEVVQNIQEEE